ncbi:hypothetical protein C8J56DRAFT_1079807 [Mycena floridula]|nr:hypothetical protein C8J56DRAFT_1079807 [Mycena floridula]
MLNLIIISCVLVSYVLAEIRVAFPDTVHVNHSFPLSWTREASDSAYFQLRLSPFKSGQRGQIDTIDVDPSVLTGSTGLAAFVVGSHAIQVYDTVSQILLGTTVDFEVVDPEVVINTHIISGMVAAPTSSPSSTQADATTTANSPLTSSPLTTSSSPSTSSSPTREAPLTSSSSSGSGSSGQSATQSSQTSLAVSQTSGPSLSSTSTPGPVTHHSKIAAIVAPVLIASILILGGLACLFIRRRRIRRQPMIEAGQGISPFDTTASSSNASNPKRMNSGSTSDATGRAYTDSSQLSTAGLAARVEALERLVSDGNAPPPPSYYPGSQHP